MREAPDFLTNADRIANRDEMTRPLTRVTQTMTRDALLAACEAQGMLAGPISDMEQVIARDLRIAPERGAGVRSRLQFSVAELVLEKSAPSLGRR